MEKNSNQLASKPKVLYRTKVRLLETNEVTDAYKVYDVKIHRCHFFKDKEYKEEFEDGTYYEIIPTPYEDYGIECCDGWRPLLKPIFEYIEKYNQDKDSQDLISIFQIKEKFGGLRVYVENSTPELNEIIRTAEAKSLAVCELCGKSDNVGTVINGWISTRCYNCAYEYAKSIKRTIKWKPYGVNQPIFRFELDEENNTVKETKLNERTS
jgi:hypothetical protein